MPTGDPVPAEGWHVRITLDDGTVLRPDVFDSDVQWIPSINGKPEAEVPVRDTDGLTEGRVDQADAAVWLDGQRLPIDSVTEVDVRSNRPTLLSLTGGAQLDRRARIDVDNRATHLVAEDLIQSETDYIADVDAPDSESLEDQQIQFADDNAGFEEAFATALEDDIPIAVENDTLVQLQSAWFFTSADLDIDQTVTITDGDAEGNEAEDFTQGGGLNLQSSFTTEYAITDPIVSVRFRADVTDPDPVILRAEIDGQLANDFSVNSADNTYEWTSASVLDSLSAGSHDLTIEVESGTELGSPDSDDELAVDVAAVHDPAGNHVLDNTPQDGQNLLETPAPYSRDISVEAETVVPALTPLSATLSIETNSTQEGQALALSGDGGATFTTESNTDELSVTFDSAESITARLSLSGWSQDVESPLLGQKPQEVGLHEVRATLDAEPRTINEGFDADVGEILRTLADQAGAIWAVERTDSGDLEVAWTLPGQRQSGAELDASNYRVIRDASQIVEAATVTGSRKSRQETISVDALDSPIALGETEIITGTERVDNADTSDEYAGAVDYHFRPVAGEIVPLSSGTIETGDTLEVTYEYNVDGRFESEAWDGSAETDTTVSIPRLSSEQACREAASRLVARQSDANVEVRVDVGSIDIETSVVEALGVEQLPDALGPFRVREVVRSAESPIVRLGSGQTVDETTDDIERSLGALETRS